MASESAAYRLRVARGFLQESRQDVELGRWRSGVDNAQLAVEHAAKTALAMIAPVGRTHNPAAVLRRMLQENLFPVSQHNSVERLAECAEMLGSDVHVQTDYGDEMGGVTPWELFGAEDARQALAFAEEAVRLHRQSWTRWENERPGETGPTCQAAPVGRSGGVAA